MKKINVLKEISLMVLILIFFSFSVYCLESNLNYIKFGGIFLLYICNYFFVNILKKVVEIGHKNIFELFLKLSVPFYSLKILLHETYRNLTNVMVIIISCGLIMILEKEFVKKCLSKEKLKKYCTLDNIKEFCIIVTPFYLLKTGDIKVIPILAIFLIYDLGLRKKKISLEVRNIIMIVAGLFFTLVGTNYLNGFNNQNLNVLEEIVIPFIFFLILIQYSFKLKNYKNLIFVSLNSLVIFYLPLFLQWKEADFSYLGRLKSFVDVTQTGVILGILQLLLLFYIFLGKNLKILPLFFINFNFLILTGSKGPLLLNLLFMFFIGMIFLRRKMRVLFILSSFLVVAILFTTDLSKGISRLKNDDGSTSIRKMIYIEAFEQFKEKPILGYGLGNYKEIASFRHKDYLENLKKTEKISRKDILKKDAYDYYIYTHSNFLELARGSGIFSVIFYYSFILYLLYKNTLMYFKTNNKILLIGILSLLYFEIYGLIDNNIIYEKLQGINLFIAALFIMYRNSIQNDEKEKK